MNRIQQWLQKVAGKKDISEQHPPRDPVNPDIVAHILDVWLEQAASLKQLRMHDHAYRIMNRARSLTLESMQADPSDPMAWVNIGRVQTEDEEFVSANETFEHAKNLAKQQGNKAVEDFAGAGLFRVRRRQGVGKDVEPSDLSLPLAEEQYQQYHRQRLVEMCYVCQGCGNLNLMAGEHCAHCRFAPQNLEQARLTICLTSLRFKIPTLLEIALSMQQGLNPYEFIDGLAAEVERVESDQGLLQKIQDKKEDDYLHLKPLDKCQSCGKKVWASSANICPHCNQPMNRPVLLKLAICVARLLSQFVWTVGASDSRAFSQFVLLLVNMKYRLIREQMGPTDTQRHQATQLLLQLNPLYTQNRGGLVRITSLATVRSEVLDPGVHKDIGPTVDYLRDELKHFLHLMSDSVSLF